MKSLSPLSTSLLVALGIATLSGCSSTMVFPDTAVTQANVPLGTITGSNYGGHAPIVGAHVFVLQAGTSGYGGAANSLLTAAQPNVSTGGFGTTQDNTTGSLTNGMYYVTTNSKGVFNITGDYTCLPGLPVYLYASGGTSSLQPYTAISSGTVGATSATFTAPNLFSVGQYVTFSLLSGTAGAGLNLGTNAIAASGVNDNTASYLVTAANLTSFTVTGAGVFALQGATGGGIATSTLPSNPAIVNLGVLGNCSSTGNFSNLSYIYLNELSTVAAAYAMGGFFSNSATSLTSTDALHMSIPAESGNTGTSPAWIGIENAANNAALLYDIQGQGQISSAGDGEGHIANLTTGNGGTVSQGLIDSIANALAACVDSGNTAATATAPCTTLLGAALPSTSGGSSPTPTGTAPKDTATAAINMAHNPWTSSASTILNLATGVVPYLPTTSSASDLAVAISYPISSGGAYAFNSVAIDAGGNAWVTAFDAGTLTKLSPVGKVLYTYQFPFDGLAQATPGDVALDSQGRAWVAIRNLNAVPNFIEPNLLNLTVNFYNDGAYLFNNAGGQISGSPFYVTVSANSPGQQDAIVGPLADSITVAIDGSDAAYFANHPFSSAQQVSATGVTGYKFGNDNFDLNGPFGVALDASGNLWMTWNEKANYVSYWSTGAGATTPQKTISNIPDPEGLALDASGNVWVANANDNNLYEIKIGASTATSYGNGGIEDAVDVVVDGAGFVIASSPAGGANNLGSLAVFNHSGVAQSGANGINGSFVSSGTTVTPLNRPYNLAVDNAGDVWVSTNKSAVEYFGFATPVLTPLSAAVKAGTLAARP
jgi:sugar lactone lactonase YvrE